MAGTVNNDRVKWLFLDVLLITFKIQKTIQKENIISFTFLLCSMFLWHQHSPQSSQSCWLNNQFQIHNHNCQQPNGKTKMIKKILPNQLQKPSCAEEHEKVESCSWSQKTKVFHLLIDLKLSKHFIWMLCYSITTYPSTMLYISKHLSILLFGERP